MGILSLFRHKGYTLKPEDTEAGHIHRQMLAERNKEIKELRQQMDHLRFLRQQKQLQDQIEDMKTELYGDVEEEGGINEEQLLLQILSPFMGNSQMIKQKEATMSQAVQLSDEEIKQILNQFPTRSVQMFSRLPEETQRKAILMRFPNVSDDTLTRAIQLIKGG